MGMKTARDIQRVQAAYRIDKDYFCRHSAGEPTLSEADFERGLSNPSRCIRNVTCWCLRCGFLFHPKLRCVLTQ